MKLRVALIALCCGALFAGSAADAKLKLPYKKEGLSKEQAAVYLLERFAFGPRPGEVERVAKMGPEKWLEQQLAANLPETELTERLKAFPALAMTSEEIQTTYVRDGQLRNRMKKEGLLDPEKASRKEIREKLNAYRKEHSLRPYGSLSNRELKGQKVVRAVYSENQLAEVLTDFWFNHFNVTVRDGQARSWVLAYERDALRPNVLGDFRTILGATAKHPAMLHYLDNVQSRIEPPPPKNPPKAAKNEDTSKPPPKPKRKYGLNENYARELMELHTLGVDGGYEQKDVTEVARILTGWATMPNNVNQRKNIAKQISRGNKNLVREGDFLFRKYWHDKKAKVVLGEKFPAGGGVEEGERVLDMLAVHPSTAHFISTKLARRFVNDNPPKALVKRMAKTFSKTNGDLAAVMAELAQSREFWAEAKTRSKMKSPFELMASSMRALEADVKNAQPMMQWLDRMGEQLYGYLEPTGFPDYAESWTNSGTLVTRMNFAVRLATGRINGITLKRLARNNNQDPLTTDQALAIYGKLLLPARDTSAIASELKGMIPEAAKRKDIQVVGMLLGSPEFQYR
ncbi:MAG: DUF1800 domain-containing protein [Candidatus Latescibacteria bacterium]|nr:DUF1800 domain-containing protein [Candidatus Latescibacterota bacterium]